MKAGRELDALVAEKVMGLKKSIRLHSTTDMIDAYINNPYFTDVVRKEDLHHVEPLHYSTSIAAAWEVVEKLSERRDPHDEQWAVHISKRKSNLFYSQFCKGCVCHTAEAEADTPSLAICLAALKTLEVPDAGV